MIGLFGFVQTSPEVDAPASAPSRRVVSFDFQGTLSGLLQRAVRQVLSWVEAYEVTLMAVLRVVVVPVVVPLVQVAVMSDGIGVQFSKCYLYLPILLAHHLASSNSVDEELADNG